MVLYYIYFTWQTTTNNKRYQCCQPVNLLLDLRQTMDACCTSHKRHIHIFGTILLIAAYMAYFIYAMIYRFGDEGSIRLLVLTIIVMVGYVIHTFKLKYGVQLMKKFHNLHCYKKAETLSGRQKRLIQ